MSTVVVTALEPDHFGVDVREGGVTTHHKVTIHTEVLEAHGLETVEGSLVVEEAINFLLEREPATSILSHFALEQIADYFPEFWDELTARIG